jgi:hypothetical protein
MAEQPQKQPKPAPELEDDLNQLLTEVEHLSQSVDMQLSRPATSEPQPSLDDAKSEPRAASADVSNPIPFQEIAPNEQNDQSAPDDKSSLQIDPEDDKLAEREIAETVRQIEADNRHGPETQENEHPTIDVSAKSIPFFVKLLLAGIVGIDHAFMWLPQTVKAFLGYIAISMLIFGIILWIIIAAYY